LSSERDNATSHRDRGGGEPSSGEKRVAARLAKQSVEEIERFIEQLVQSPGTPRSKELVLRVLSLDARPAVRVRVAETAWSLGKRCSQLAEDTLRLLARDPRSEVRAAAIDAMRRWLERVEPLRRSRILCEWSVARNSHVRAAAARALVDVEPTPGTRTAVLHLVEDTDPDVRQTAARAARTQFDDGDEAFRKLLDGSSRDSGDDLQTA